MSLDLTIVRIVAGPAFDRAAEERIVRDFKARLGEAVEVRVEQVAEIAAESSGKFRYVVSQVKALGSARGAADA
ncbi:MAG: hypothetical protein AW07_00136 [Candidatus Accumulibacter sp. SK-11]|nr:MAG: hypothetical protein AW07_00136 [Candidatus Accumulibacter sp. SK-11]